jgi:hypothetical protein
MCSPLTAVLKLWDEQPVRLWGEHIGSPLHPFYITDLFLFLGFKRGIGIVFPDFRGFRQVQRLVRLKYAPPLFRTKSKHKLYNEVYRYKY